VHPADAEDIEFDQENEGHLARHAITPAEVVQVWLSGPVYVPNKKGMTATWLMLGDSYGGRALTVAVLCNETWRRLRPITGWDSNRGELTRWRPDRAP
jgi:hypothetical protein